MLFKCLDLWVPPVFRQGELALSSTQRSFESDAWVSDSLANIASSVAKTQVNSPYMLHVRTDFCSGCVIANLR